MLQRQQIEQWMTQDALPLWLECGFDKSSGTFREALNFDGSDANIAFRRTRVSCRQIYVYSHAAVRGWQDGLPAAEHSARWLVAHAWRADDKGFVRRLAPDNSVLDATIDLYDNAFAVFAFAWLARATGSTWARVWAAKTLDAIRSHWRHPGGEGFWHDEQGQMPRQQNPHMHLMEACLAGHVACGDRIYLDTAHELSNLFATRLFDGTTLAEFFDDGWQRMPDGAIYSGRHIEPGHMLEWAWILAEYARASGIRQDDTVGKLIGWATRHGVDPTTGITYNAVRDDGTPLDRGSRTWPNTERLKAIVAAHGTLKHDPANTRAAAAQTIAVLMNRYLATPLRGGWIDHFREDGSIAAANMPASTFYHVYLALAEALAADGLIN